MVEKLNHFEIKPDKEIKSAVIFLHGYGANGKDLLEIGNIWKKSFPETVFVSPNAPFNCPWGGEAFQWFELTSIAPEKIGEGLERAGPHLNKFIDDVSEIYNLENKKIFFVGFSQGTMMALYHLCKRKKECAGLIGYSGLLYENDNFEKEISSRFPIMLYHGKKDEVIDYNFSLQAHQKFNEFGFKINFELSDTLGHGIDDQGLKLGESFIKNIFYV